MAVVPFLGYFTTPLVAILLAVSVVSVVLGEVAKRPLFRHTRLTTPSADA